MKIRILSSNLAEITGKEIEINIDGEITFDELKEIITERFPKAKEEINDIFYNFSINGELVKKDELGKIKIKDGDSLIIFPSIAGG